MFSHPGKKLLFMGAGFGQGTEWDTSGIMDWNVLDYAFHQKLQQLANDLNRPYAGHPPGSARV